jgi:hypothetical protein
MKRENILFLQVQNLRLMLDLNTQHKKGCPNQLYNYGDFTREMVTRSLLVASKKGNIISGLG